MPERRKPITVAELQRQLALDAEKRVPPDPFKRPPGNGRARAHRHVRRPSRPTNTDR